MIRSVYLVCMLVCWCWLVVACLRSETTPADIVQLAGVVIGSFAFAIVWPAVALFGALFVADRRYIARRDRHAGSVRKP